MIGKADAVTLQDLRRGSLGMPLANEVPDQSVLGQGVALYVHTE
jgi:hypothetical protein